MTMRQRALLLALLGGVLLACAPGPRAAGGDDADAQATAETGSAGMEKAEATAKPEQPKGGGKPAAGVGQALGAVLILVLVIGAVVLLATAAAVTAVAVFPGATERSREWTAARPWLCIGWGAGVGLFLLVMAGFAGQNLGPIGPTVVLLELMVAKLAAIVGFAGIAEWLGQRVFGQLSWRTPGRPVTVLVGALLLYLSLFTPAGWLAAPFLGCLALGAVRLSLKGLPEAEVATASETPYVREP
jgi:hypothetical protein